MAASLSKQGKHADAERIEREVLGARRRVLGEEHPDTLKSAGNLALSLLRQRKHVEAEEMFQATHQAQQRVLGSAHRDTLATAEFLEVVRKDLEFVRSEMRAKQPTKKGAKAAARKKCVAAATLSPTTLAEAEARAGAAEAELLAMLELEEVGPAGSSSSAKGKAKGNASKR